MDDKEIITQLLLGPPQSAQAYILREIDRLTRNCIALSKERGMLVIQKEAAIENAGFWQLKCEEAEDKIENLRSLLEECSQALIDCTHPHAARTSTAECRYCDLGRRIDSALVTKELT